VDEFKRQVSAHYFEKTGKRPEIYVSSASEGAQQMDAGTIRSAI
jgi:galactokinase